MEWHLSLECKYKKFEEIAKSWENFKDISLLNKATCLLFNNNIINNNL